MLIDESTQATEPECLIPLVLGVKQVLCALVAFFVVWFSYHIHLKKPTVALSSDKWFLLGGSCW